MAIEHDPVADDHAPQKGMGRRCAIGCESWPDTDDYATCPLCGEVTTRYNNLIALSLKDAEIKAAYAKFEDYYTEHCINLGQPTTGPLEWDGRFGPEPVYEPEPPKPTSVAPRQDRPGRSGGAAFAAA